MMPARQRNVVVLPAPFGPTRPDDFAGLDGKRKFVHGGELAVKFGETFDLNHAWPSGCGLLPDDRNLPVKRPGRKARRFACTKKIFTIMLGRILIWA